ncbi:hypothetical protein QCA50_007437 [Cerrena zonata]|uniref:Uncharacterized protein n=1 Tax=Cerrena zonata TaxID=2478898 RepID=A0AAW0GE37_9APHY
MPKDMSKPRRAPVGVSRQVQTTTFVHPSQSASTSSMSYPAATHRITQVLGFKAKGEAVAKAKEQMKERMEALNSTTRKILEDLQKEAGTLLPDDIGIDVQYEPMQVDPLDNDPAWVDEIEPSSAEQLEIVHGLRDLRLHLLKGMCKRPVQNWKQRRKQEMSAWNPLIEDLAGALLTWKYGALASSPGPNEVDNDLSNPSDAAPPPDTTFEYTADVYDIFSLESSITIHRPPSSTSVPVDLATHGYLAKTPISPTICIGFRTLEHFHRLRLRQPSLSIEAFTKVICDHYQIPYRRYLRTILAETYEIFLRISRVVDKRVQSALGWDTENWRVSNACVACCYMLQDEPPIKFSHLWAHDGNNSLKRMLPVGNRIAADTRVYEDSDYFLPREFVDRYANEVKSRRKDGKEPHRQVDAEGSDDDEDSASEGGHEGDPTDGVNTESHPGVHQCVKNWKAAASDEKKKTWSIFDETGIYASACRHGFILWIADMVRSGELAKYPLSVVAKSLEVLPASSAGGMDIACGFAITAANSCLAGDIIEKKHKFVVNAFHGYSHNYQCQRKNHPNIVEGVGLEDFETMERTFSSSNALASIIRYASAFRRRLFIDTYFRQWDEDKYTNLGTFILHNYQQALKILNEDVAAFEEAKRNLKISDADLDLWEKEQAEYFEALGKEPEGDRLKVEYVELLQALDKAANEKAHANLAFLGNAGDSIFVTENPSPHRAAYAKAVSTTLKLETRRRVTRERYDNILQEVIELEVQFQIPKRWVPGDPEYMEALKYIAERKYTRALDRLQQLVVQRLFELHKMNLSGTAYKTRTLLAKSLQKRSKAIRKAVATYNAAAAAINPPRDRIDMSEITEYNFIEEFALLQDTRNDIRHKPWAKPLYREVFRLRHRIARAKEEILRCNVETRRLYTSIHDHDLLFKDTLAKLKSDESSLYGAVRDFVIRRTRINLALLARVQQISTLDGFTGDISVGVRVGCATTAAAPAPEVTLLDLDGGLVPDEPGNDSDELDVEGEDFEDDDDFQREVRGLENFFQTMSV